MKKIVAKLNDTRNWFLEKRNKTDKPLARLIKKKGGKTQVYKIRSEKEATMDTTEIQQII